jgi:endonuclease/exonuclease/phosphatase family metal-dependent hydrolase
VTGTLRVGSWNIHELISDGGERRAVSEILEQVGDAALDVLLLQEVPFAPGGQSALLDLLTERTTLRFASSTLLSRSVHDPGLRSGVAVVSRCAQSAHAGLLLPNPGLRAHHAGREVMSWDKGAHFVHLELGDAPVCAGSVHSFPLHVFGRNPAEPAFEPVWRALAEALDNRPEPWALLGGDFNAVDRDLLFRFVTRRRLSSSNKGIGTHNGRAVDDIVHDRDITLREFSVVDGFSDHALCLAEFEIERSTR